MRLREITAGLRIEELGWLMAQWHVCLCVCVFACFVSLLSCSGCGTLLGDYHYDILWLQFKLTEEAERQIGRHLQAGGGLG